MDKVLKIAVIILCALLLVNLLKGLFKGDDNLKEAIKNIKASQQKIDSSLLIINTARNQIDSIQSTMEVFKHYVNDIQGRVEILDLQNRVSMRQYQRYKDSLQDRLKNLYAGIDTTASNLPDIVIAN